MSLEKILFKAFLNGVSEPLGGSETPLTLPGEIKEETQELIKNLGKISRGTYYNQGVLRLVSQLDIVFFLQGLLEGLYSDFPSRRYPNATKDLKQKLTEYWKIGREGHSLKNEGKQLVGKISSNLGKLGNDKKGTGAKVIKNISPLLEELLIFGGNLRTQISSKRRNPLRIR